VLELTSEHYNRLSLIMSTISLDREPLRDALRTLALPAIGALYLPHGNSAKCITAATYLIGQPDKFACPGSIDNLYLYGGHCGLEFCVGVSQSIEHMFEYKTGV
jgi:hypothetical protein